MRPYELRPPLEFFVSSSFFSGSFFVIEAKSWLDMPRRPGEVGLYLWMAMVLDSLEELDRLAGGQGHDRLLAARADAGVAPHPLLLAAHQLRVHVRDLDVEQLLHRAADLDLVGVEGDLERDLGGVLLALAEGPVSYTHLTLPTSD